MKGARLWTKGMILNLFSYLPNMSPPSKCTLMTTTTFSLNRKSHRHRIGGCTTCTSQTQKGTLKVWVQLLIFYRGPPTPRLWGALPGRGVLYLSWSALRGAAPQAEGGGWHNNWLTPFKSHCLLLPAAWASMKHLVRLYFKSWLHNNILIKDEE